MSAYSTDVLADSPQLYLRLGETSGSTAFDSSGNSRNGTYTVGTTLGAAGLLNGDTDPAIQTAQNSGQGAVVASAAWMNLSAITVECWASVSSPADATNGDAIMSRYGAGGFNWLLWRNGAGRWAVQLRNNAGTAYNIAAAAVASLNTIYHLAFTFDGSALTLYVNGSSAATTAVTGTLQTGTEPIRVGAYSGQASTTPGATFDEAAVFGSALSAARILSHYTTGSTTPPPAALSGVWGLVA